MNIYVQELHFSVLLWRGAMVSYILGSLIYWHAQFLCYLLLFVLDYARYITWNSITLLFFTEAQYCNICKKKSFLRERWHCPNDHWMLLPFQTHSLLRELRAVLNFQKVIEFSRGIKHYLRLVLNSRNSIYFVLKQLMQDGITSK
jgi:hypothetical protein